MKFKGHESGTWHKNISDTVGSRKPTDADFPWLPLQNHTGYYLKKKGKLSQDEIDNRLLDLIKKHPSKEVAIAACADKISVRIIRSLLVNDFKVDRDNAIEPQEYCQVIIAANHVNPGAVCEIETQWARYLLEYAAAGSPRTLAQQLHKVLCLLPARPAPDLLLQDEFDKVAGKVCTSFAYQLEDLRRKNQWMDAHAATEWLSTASFSSDTLQRHLLDSCLPRWEVWAAWRPHIPRLRAWKMSALCAHSSLGDLLALEGPDFASNVGSEQATLRKGLTVQGDSASQSTLQWGSSRVNFGRNPFKKLENLNGILERLMNVIDFASSAGSEYKALLACFCGDNPVSNDGLQILEGVQILGRPDLTMVIVQVLSVRKQNLHQVLEGIMHLLPSLSNSRIGRLRDLMQPYIVDRISAYVRELQETLLMQLNAGNPWLDTAMAFLVLTLGLREQTWLLVKLDHSVQQLIASGHSRMATIETLGVMRNFARSTMTSTPTSLLSHIDAYFKIWLMPDCTVNPNILRLIEALINLWQQNSDRDRRELALLIADLSIGSYQFRCECLQDITILGTTWVSSTLEGFNFHNGNPDLGCFALIGLLASTDRPDILERWRKVLSFAIDKQHERLLSHALTHQTTCMWLGLLDSIRVVYEGSELVRERRSPNLLSRELYMWSRQIAEYLPQMERLEKVLKHGPAMRMLFLGTATSEKDQPLRVLDLLKNKTSKSHGNVMDIIITKLNNSNVEVIEDVLSVVSKASLKGAVACLHVLKSSCSASPGVTEVVLATKIRSDDILERDRLALRKVAGLLKISLDAEGYPSAAGLKEAANCVHEKYLNLMTEARRLENLRLSLQAVNPKGVSKLLVKLHIEASSVVDDATVSLPPSLGSLVERISKSELELQFPATELTKLQRFAIGAGDAESFLIRLTLGHDGKPIKFCIHLSADSNNQTNSRASDGKGHTPWEVFRGNRAPYEHYCYGRPNRGVYQLSRILWHHLRHNFRSLEQTHAHLTAKLSRFGQGCAVCGVGQMRLRRATLCTSPSCRSTFSQAHVEIQLAEMWQDPPVMDLLVNMVHATASTGKLDLLVDCPATNASVVVSMLDVLPAIPTLAENLRYCLEIYGNRFCLAQTLEAYCTQSFHSTLLSSGLLWVCTSYRGFLVSATGPHRIPSFGNNQFLLANMGPDIERAFSHQMPNPQSPSQILFHGTSLDRLHAILCQGLRVQSGTALQRHGAYHGPGIYVADEPVVAWGYATVSSGGWKSSKLKDMKVLLGCELAGSKPQAPYNGIYVISDATRLAVRYIFLLAGDARMPAAKDVRLPMASVFQGLRSGTL